MKKPIRIFTLTVLLATSLFTQTAISLQEGEIRQAAAATIVEMVDTSAGPGSDVWEIDINRPFLYFIHETSTGTILFMGRVSDPTADQK
jgi:serine protease inhibitor